MIRHVDHLLARLGEDGVALGSDFDGALIPREIGDVAGLPALVGAMRQAGYGAALIERICWVELARRPPPHPGGVRRAWAAPSEDGPPYRGVRRPPASFTPR